MTALSVSQITSAVNLETHLGTMQMVADRIGTLLMIAFIHGDRLIDRMALPTYLAYGMFLRAHWRTVQAITIDMWTVAGQRAPPRPIR